MHLQHSGDDKIFSALVTKPKAKAFLSCVGLGGGDGCGGGGGWGGGGGAGGDDINYGAYLKHFKQYLAPNMGKI